MTGRVYLIGAGPGDYGLLTIKACECLKKADVIVYDRLADPRILEYAKPEAEYIYVGKASNQHTMKQEDINRLLVRLAQEGKIVARLKGGDPFVFGRGGEEALLLQENGLPFEIVPGVTSAISVPAYAGIPVTHRGIATSFAVVTGHEKPGKEVSDINWPKLATGPDTLVFLMGVANIGKITQELMAHGRSGSTPAAIIRWGTKASQQVWTTTVAEAATLIEEKKIKPPCIFIVGEVVKLRESLAWFDNIKMKPLFGKKIIVTRARKQASELTKKLELLGAECLELPTIRIEAPEDNYLALDKALEDLRGYKWIIFTSVNGVEHFFNRLEKANMDARYLPINGICAIGSATAGALAAKGILADIVPEKYVAEGIIASLEDKLLPGDRVLLPRAQKAREILPQELQKRGAIVDEVPAYQTVADLESGEELKEALRAGDIDMITFTSSSTVENMFKFADEEMRSLLQAMKAVAIGPITGDTCRKYGLEPVEAEVYTIEGLVEAIKGCFACSND